MTGSGDTLRPAEPITRAEAAVLLDRVRTAARVFSVPGTYGPTSGTEPAGSVTLLCPGILLQNYAVSGDLEIAVSVGDGQVSLSNVSVTGALQMRGGARLSLSGRFAEVHSYVSGADISLNEADISLITLFAPARVSGTGAIETARVESGAGADTVFEILPQNLTGPGAPDAQLPAPSGGGGLGGGGGGGDAPPPATGKITGKVTDGASNVSGAAVRLGGTALTTLTASDGTYTLLNVPPGEGYTLTAEKFGYGLASASATVTAGSTTGNINLALPRMTAVFTKVTAYGAGTFTLAGVDDPIPLTSASGYESLAVGDYVSFVLDGDIYRLSKAQLVESQIVTKSLKYVRFASTGQIHRVSGCDNLTDLTTFDQSILNTMDFLHDYTVYLDPFGDIVAIDDSNITVSVEKGFFLLLSADAGSGSDPVKTVTIHRFPTKPLRVNTDSALTMAAFEDCDDGLGADNPVLVQASIERSVLTVLSIGIPFTDDIEPGYARIGTDNGADIMAGNTTSFFIYSTASGTYQQFTGFNNVPTVNGEETLAYYLPNLAGDKAAFVLVITGSGIPPVGPGPEASRFPVFLLEHLQTDDEAYTYLAATKDKGVIALDSQTLITEHFHKMYLCIQYQNNLCSLIPYEESGAGGVLVSGVVTANDGEGSVTVGGTTYVIEGGIYQTNSTNGHLSPGDEVLLLVEDGAAQIIVITADH